MQTCALFYLDRFDEKPIPKGTVKASLKEPTLPLSKSLSPIDEAAFESSEG